MAIGMGEYPYSTSPWGNKDTNMGQEDQDLNEGELPGQICPWLQMDKSEEEEDEEETHISCI